MTDIQIDDDIRVKFTADVLLEIFDAEDFDANFPIQETYDAGDEVEVTVLDVFEDARTITVQFPDSSVTFLPMQFVEVISVN